MSSSEEKEQESMYVIKIEEHPKAFYVLSLIKVLIFIPIIYLCVIQLMSLFDRYSDSSTTFRLVDFTTGPKKAKNRPMIKSTYPAITVCSPTGAKENVELVTSTNLTDVELMFNNTNRFDEFSKSIFEYQRSYLNPEYFLSWIMFCELSPKVEALNSSFVNDKLGCQQNYIISDYFTNVNNCRDACVTFKLREDVMKFTEKVSIDFLFGKGKKFIKKPMSYYGDDPLVVEEILNNENEVMKVYVHNATHAPDTPFTMFFHGSLLYANVIKSAMSRTSSDEAFLPLANEKLCHHKNDTFTLVAGKELRVYDYSSSLCKKLLHQDKVYEKCGCWSSNLPVKGPWLNGSYYCDSIKMVVEKAVSLDKFIEKRQCLADVMKDNEKSFYSIADQNKACPRSCDAVNIVVSSDQINLANRLSMFTFFSLLERTTAIQNKLSEMNKSSSSINEFLSDDGLMPQFRLSNFASVTVELSDIRIIKSEFKFSYTFDLLLADIGGILGLYLDFTVVGFFEDMDKYFGALVLVGILILKPFMQMGKYLSKIWKKKKVDPSIVEGQPSFKLVNVNQ